MSDVSSELGDLIAKSKTFGNSDNIRCGRYKFLIKRVFAEKVESGRFAFAELKVIESGPNPQAMPGGVSASQFDEGMRPNLVGSDCAMKVNFDGNGAKSAPGNVKAFILGLFGMNQSETSEEDVNNTWRDLTRQKDLKVGDAIGINPANNTAVLSDKAKRANPACGMVISCTASMKEKRKTKLLPNDQKEYVTVLNWECFAKPGVGENSAELVAKRRGDIEANMVDDDEVEVATNGHATNGHVAPPAPTAPAVTVAPPAPPAPPTPAGPPAYLLGWEPHPQAPGYFWKQGVAACFTEAQLAAGAGK